MSGGGNVYAQLQQRLDRGEVLLLDGAVGTQLQAMDVPMNNIAWAACALHTHPDSVRLMHAKYLRAGADILTTNTYSAARHNLEPLGLGDATAELNRRAVNLAQEARVREAGARSVAIAGSVSNFGILVQGEPHRALHRHARARSEISAAQARANLREQAEVLADAGVDLLLAEATGGMAHREWVAEACLATGLPLWLGFKCRLEAGEVMIGYSSATTLAEGLAQTDLQRVAALALFHTAVATSSAALPLLRAAYSGPLAVYPEAERSDYTAERRDAATPNLLSPEAYCREACRWVESGVQIVGGCCGIDLPYIEALRGALPARVPG